MHHLAPVQLVAICALAVLGGATNSIAGGGMLLVFPGLIALGVPPIAANATSTVSLWPGTIASMWGYRGELTGAREWAVSFAIPNVLGGLAGALLLLATPELRFKALVPWLVLAATLLFAAQQPVMRWFRREGGVVPHSPAVNADGTLRPPGPVFLVVQFAIAIYGGYFGAGAGILMLGILGFIGLTNIHQMNGLKNWAGTCFNGVAIFTFVVAGKVDWPLAAVLGVSAGVGGYLGSGLAQRVPQSVVRGAVVVIGLTYVAWLLTGHR